MVETSTASPTSILIVGGGAGGLELAVRLGRKLGRSNRARITLVDAARTHLWKPMLHQVAAGTLDSHADELEYVALARKNHFRFRYGRLDGLNRAERYIELAPVHAEEGEELLPRRRVRYDVLVLAFGSQSNDFATPGAGDHAIFLDSLDSARRFNRKLFDACVRAHTRNWSDNEGVEPMTAPGEPAPLRVTIVGGGATGVELAAELHMSTALLSNYGLDNIHPDRDLKITIIDSAPRLLTALPERISAQVAQELRRINVTVHHGERVVAVRDDGVLLQSGRMIPSTLVVWAAGIKVAEIASRLDGLDTNHLNQIVVTPTLQTRLDPRIFALGDCAACPRGPEQPTVPPRAQAAHQQASHLSTALDCYLAGKPLPTFRYRDYGSLVSMGRYSTVGTLMGRLSKGSLFVDGMFAKYMYWSLHKLHQMAVLGGFGALLATCSEFIARVNNPRIKLH